MLRAGRLFALTAFVAPAAVGLAGVLGQPSLAQPTETRPPSFTDAEIAHIAVTANAIDVEMAELATDRTSNPDVRQFARTMIEDHSAVNERASALAARLGVEPESNEVSQSLREDAEAARSKLQGLRGSAFDRAYMEREIAYHQAVLDALDDLLIPGAENSQLRSLLKEVRPVIATHLEHARAIGESLAVDR